MGIFDFLKNKPVNTQPHTLQPPGENLNRLTAEGELPWGWHTYTKDFTSKINGEYSYFLNNWLDSRNKSPMEQYAALKSFVMYLEDVEKICQAKGECFEFWFNEILTGNGYLDNRKEELNQLALNINRLQSTFNKKMNLTPEVVKRLKQNPGILQSDFKKLFDDNLQDEVSNVLYKMSQSGEIERIKVGRTYKLYHKG